MNRTKTAPQALALLATEKTIGDLAQEMGVPRSTAKGAIQRLQAKGKLDRRVDELGYVQWKAKSLPK